MVKFMSDDKTEIIVKTLMQSGIASSVMEARRMAESMILVSDKVNKELDQNQTGNYSVKKNSNGNDLKAGIYYNYSEITDLSIFKELNVFLRKAIHSNKFGNKLSQIQKDEISGYSFLFGFNNKVYNSIRATEMKRIKACWE